MPACRRLWAYALVGIAVAGSYVGLYVVLRRLGLAEMVANGLAFALAIVIQYVGQANLTFRRPLADLSQILRFAAMIGAGLVTSSLIAAWVGPDLELTDGVTASLIALLLPVQNYLLMCVWVFSEPPALSEDAI